MQLLQQAEALLDMSLAMFCLKSEPEAELLHFSQAPVPAISAGLQLAVTAVSSISSMLQLTGLPRESVGVQMQRVFVTARYFGNLCVEHVNSPGRMACEPDMAAALAAMRRSPHFVPCQILAMAMSAYGLLAQQLEAAGQAATTTTSSSSSRKARQQKRVQTQVQQSWELGQQLQQHITPVQQKLFGALGVSSTMLLWAAATVRDSVQPRHVEMLQVMDGGDDSSSSSGGDGVAAQAQMYLLLPSLTLNTAAALLRGNPDCAEVTVPAAAAALCALHKWQELTDGSTGADATAAAGAVQAVHELLLDVLPAVLSMLTQMLQVLHKGVPSSSSSNSSGAPAGTNAAEQGYRAAAAAVVAVLCRLLPASLPTSSAAADSSTQPLAASDAGAGTSSSSSSSSSSDKQLLSALQAEGQLGTILRWLEGVVRLTAAAPAWLRLAQDKGASMDRLSDSFRSLEAVCRLLDKHSCSFIQFVCSAGLGSAEVRELQGLLVSLMKAGQACAAASPAGEPKKGFHMAAGMARDAAVACTGTLMCSFATTTTTTTSSSSSSSSTPATAAVAGRATTAAAAEGAGAATTATAAEGRGGAAAAAAAGGGSAIKLLPSLVVAGRWCLQTAERMRAQAPALIANKFRLKKTSALSFLTQEMFGRRSGEYVPFEPLGKVPEACLVFLQGGDMSAQLAAAGYSPLEMQQAASALLQALQTVEAYGSGSESVDGAVAVTAMVQQLQALGQSLTAVAIPHACNNPSCGNVSELKEQKVVSGSGRTCGNCRVARYCSKECSAQHWPQHKPVCNAVKKAARTVPKF